MKIAGQNKRRAEPAFAHPIEPELSRSFFANMYFALTLVEFDHAVLQREKRVVAAAADVYTGMKLCAQLANKDAAGGYFLSTKTFYAATLRIGVATVAG